MQKKIPLPARLLHHLRLQLRDLLELWLIPSLCIFLPWSISFTLYRRLARIPWFFRKKITQDIEIARKYGLIKEKHIKDFADQRRLITLIDIADCFLSYTRSDKWMKKHMQIKGEWPDDRQAGLLLGFHWGSGAWLLRHAATHSSTPIRMMIMPQTQENKYKRPLLYLSGLFRLRHIEYALGNKNIDAQKGLKAIYKTLHKQQKILALIDVPPDVFQSPELQTELFHYHISVSRGLFHLAARRSLPISIFHCAINTNTGKRELHIQHLPLGQDQEKNCHDSFRILNTANRRQPAQWHFYNILPRFISPATTDKQIAPIKIKEIN